MYIIRFKRSTWLVKNLGRKKKVLRKALGVLLPGWQNTSAFACSAEKLDGVMELIHKKRLP